MQLTRGRSLAGGRAALLFQAAWRHGSCISILANLSLVAATAAPLGFGT